MATTTPNIGLTLPTGAENVSRQIINDNNTKIDTAIGTLNSNVPFRRMKGVPANGSATFTFPSYVESAIIFSAISNTNGFIYIYANGYLCPVKTATGATVTVSADYKTITVANSTSAAIYAACISCVNAIT